MKRSLSLSLSLANRSKRGFSLVELSIVLVILGLLVGGVLSGQSLIRAAELRSVSSDIQKYSATMYSSRYRYFAFPGDMANATQFWGSADGTGGDVACMNAQVQGVAATCNGTGDGQSDSITGYVWAERFLAWKHMANAGLIEGSYTGKNGAAPGTYAKVRGVNLPAGKMSSSSYDWLYVTEASSVGNWFTATNFDAHVISMFGASLKPEEAWNLDTKMDDGSPVNGRFSVHRPSSVSYPGNTCATSDADTATYNLTSTTSDCSIIYILR